MAALFMRPRLELLCSNLCTVEAGSLCVDKAGLLLLRSNISCYLYFDVAWLSL